MSDTTDIQIPFIRPDAQVTLTIGTQLISGLQGVLTNLLQDHTEQELADVRDTMSTGGSVPQWASDASCLTLLMQTILDSATAAGMVDYRPMSSLVSS